MNQARIWVDQGVHKFKGAIALFNARLWQDACLASQQTAEMMGKAILCHCDIPFRNTHDLGLIYKQAEDTGILTLDLDKTRATNVMTRDYLDGRYPRPDSERPPFTLYDQTDALERLQWALDFYDMAAHLMPDIVTEENSSTIHELHKQAMGLEEK